MYLYKSTIRSYMEYCCHVWSGTPTCYSDMLNKLQKRLCRAVDPSRAASLKPLTDRRNQASLSFFGRCYFGKYSSKLNWFHYLILEGVLLIILIDCMIFLSPYLDVIRMSRSTARLKQLDSALCRQIAVLFPKI